MNRVLCHPSSGDHAITPTGLVSEGVPEPQARQIAVEYVRSNVKFLFQEAEIPAPVMFDVKSKAGS
jgi:hypothetical protein